MGSGVRQGKCDGKAAGQAACSEGEVGGGDGGELPSERPFSNLHFHHAVYEEVQGHFPLPGKWTTRENVQKISQVSQCQCLYLSTSDN